MASSLSISELYLLFESSAGYMLSKVNEWEEIAQDNQSVRLSVDDDLKFSNMVKCIAFLPFKNSQEAVDNMKAISNGEVTKELITFLELHFPKISKKKSKNGSISASCLLGVGDINLAKTFVSLGFPATVNSNINELLRGCRSHLYKMVKSLKELPSLSVFQVSLAHNYSRLMIKFDPNRQDKPIIQSICLLDSLDKNINTFSMRIREWYGWHFPELNKIITDNITYCKIVNIIAVRDHFDFKNQKNLLLDACLGNEEIVKDVINALKHSMGQDLVETDMINIKRFADQVLHIFELRNQLNDYLEKKLNVVAPNLKVLLGETLAARLISHAGSVVNLAKYPSSTIQILGAEKALFRALKTKGNTPKYGLLFKSSFIGRAAQKNKGRISRYLANKCSLAARIDHFTTARNSIFGEKLKDQVESRLRYISEGIVPRKNIDVMREAMVDIQKQSIDTTKTENIINKKKRKLDEKNNVVDTPDNISSQLQPKKKKVPTATLR